MASSTSMVTTQVETQHEDMIHDAQLDFYGKRLATCSSDRTVKVFDVVDPSASTAGIGGGAGAGGVGGEGRYTLVDTLKGHDGPVWQVAWAHPKFGSILASCSYDGRVFVWRETSPVAGSAQRSGWEKIKEHTLHTASVNSIAWAPHELGSILACASSDGRVSVLTFNDDGTWEASLFAAHAIGANAVSWAPSTLPSSLTSPSAPNQHMTPSQRFATGGCDGLVKLWSYRPQTKTYELDEALQGHSDWVRDVAFAPGIGLPRTYLASCGQDRMVNVWTQDGPKGVWVRQALNPNPGGGTSEGKFSEVVWRVSWSDSGNVLAVCAGDGKVSLWKENLKGFWECVSEMQQ